MANTPKAKTVEPTPQDEAVNEGPPKFGRLSDLMQDSLVTMAREALGANREMMACDQQGRLWTFQPDASDGTTSLKVSLAYGEYDLGYNRVPSSQLQCEAGDALLRSVIVLLAGGHHK